MADPFVAEIRIFGFNFAPKGWAFCDGQLLPLSQNTALFSLLGTTYGGDGKSNFALPDVQGRAPMHPGQGPGLSTVQIDRTVAPVVLPDGTTVRYAIVGTPFMVQQMGLGFDKQDPQFGDALKKALAALVSDGTYQKLVSKWGLNDSAIRQPMINGQP